VAETHLGQEGAPLLLPSICAGAAGQRPSYRDEHLWSFPEQTMPKRSNAFQELVALLERQLAPSGARVYESRMLKDICTGEDREVDIVIDTEAGVHPLRIGIEVIDHERPASSPWIESIAKKHEDLPIDKSIVVSRSGFYRPAMRKAQALKIDTLTLKEATDLDWKAKIDSVPSIHIESFLLPYLTEATVLFADENSLSTMKDLDLPNLSLYRPSGESRGTLLSILKQFLAREDVIKALRERAFTDAATVVEGEFRLQKGSYILGGGGTQHPVSGIAFKAKCSKEINIAQLQKGRYRDAAVVLASGHSFGRPVRIVISETSKEDPLVTMRVYKVKNKQS